MRKPLILAFLSISTCISPVQADSISTADRWNVDTNLNSDVLSQIPKKIIRRIDTKQLPVSRLVTELSKTVSMNAIIDKPVDNKTITTNYTDATVDEILRGTFAKARLDAKFLDDNTFLVETQKPQEVQHKRINVGDFDKTPPLSIEIQRQDKLREEQAAKARRQQELYSQKYYQNYGSGGFVPPPPPTAFPWPQGFAN